jgi:transcription elongation factor
VEKGNNCYLINTNINNKNRAPQYQMSNRDPNDPNQRPRGKDSWVGQQCIIKKGGWKGFEGIIKDADDKTARVELSAKARVITIPREFIGLKNEPAEANDYESTSRMDQSNYRFIVFVFFESNYNNFSRKNTDTSWNAW